jgi:hypothetical protein
MIVLGIGFVVSLGFFVDVVGRIQSMVNDTDTAEDPFTAPSEPLYAPTDPPMPVKIFFPPSAGDDILLTTENETIFQSAEVINRARQILQKVQEGPASSTLLPALPQDTRVEEIFISEDGVAIIDFTNTISTNHPGGILNEQATIYSIVNSLTYNLPDIQQVKILIGGTEKETLAGHCLLLLPFTMDLSITDMPEQSGQTAALGRPARP